MKPLLVWEELDSFNQRAKVPCGWLVKTFEPVFHLTDLQQVNGWDFRVAMVFIADEKHSWGLDSNE